MISPTTIPEQPLISCFKYPAREVNFNVFEIQCFSEIIVGEFIVKSPYEAWMFSLQYKY